MLNPDYRDILSAFSDEKVDYLLVGAFALAVHGHPRATGDIDLWVRPDTSNAARVMAALARFGAPTTDVSDSDFSAPGIVYQIGVAPRRIDVLTMIDGIPDFQDAWESRVEVEIEGITVPTIGLQHLIQNKRSTGRPQDLADVAWLETRADPQAETDENS